MNFNTGDRSLVSVAVYRGMDLMRELCTPVITVFTAILNHASPNAMWTALYAFMLIGSYLFHSPFRAHSAALQDTYGRLMKVFQIWAMVLLSLVHLGPIIFKKQQEQMESQTSSTDDYTVAYLFIPLCVCLVAFFLLFHKMKRKWRLGVTYGAHASSVLLNSMMLAMLATMHYVYMSRVLREGAAPPHGFWANAFWFLKSLISPRSVIAHPVRAVCHLLLVCGTIVFGDYQYKRSRNFDPTRGLLWADLFDLRKEREESSELAPPVEFLKTGARKKEQDWRLLENKPHRYRPEELRAWRRVIRAGQGSSTSDNTSLQDSDSAVLRDVTAPYQRYDYQHVVHDAKTRTRRAQQDESSPNSSSLSTPSAGGSISAFPTVPLSTMKLSFATPSYEIEDIRNGKHPVGKAGMVAWWSSFAFSTGWQAGLNSALKFLTFDVRSLQTLVEPKVFSLTFSKQLPSKLETANAEASEDPPSPRDDGADVWFDWIADVGDGFNPTYDMARVMAQPQLRLKPSNEACDERLHHTGTTRERKAAADASVVRTASSSFSRERLARQNSDAGLGTMPTEYTLPRGSFVVVGGDLAYPRPTEETYTTRLFEPYRDALSGSPQLRKLFHARQMELVRPDESDADVAHLHLLDAETVAGMACGADTLRASRGTAEDALHSVPLLFAIPGNHDWFDGLRTFRKYIMEKTWIGGWLMPQRSSFFVLRLPYNWFMLCCDTGNEQDIDVAQRNYFLDVIEKYMDASSCVMLACHEPGWLFDGMEQRTEPLQPEIDRLVTVLGTRLRLRLAGDIHNYSRHAPVDPLSEAATLIVSGGGGAYLAGARDDKIVSQGTVYKRFGAFPRHNTYLSIATRLWGFRVVNWKFDMIVGVTCFGLIFSALPLPADVNAFRDIKDVSTFMSIWWSTVVASVAYFFEEAWGSYIAALFLFTCFSSAGADRPVASYWRCLSGICWTFVVLLACCAMLSALQCTVLFLASNDMVASTPEAWKSFLEEDVLLVIAGVVANVTKRLGPSSPIAHAVTALYTRFTGSAVEKGLCLALRAMDTIDTLAFTSMKVSSNRAGHFADDASRLLIGMYYMHVFIFYWVLVTPIVSFIIGVFLAISVTMFDFMYDGGYSAFQIEDFKHFMRFRIDRHTRELEVFVIGKEKVPKVWESDPRHLQGLNDVVEKDQPPHLRSHPSRWRPSTRANKVLEMASVLERFVIRPHQLPSEDN